MKRTFCANGKVDPVHHFFVSPSKWNEQILLPNLLKGTYTTLIAPSQSGKTTRVATLITKLNSNSDIIALYIDVSEVLTRKYNFFQSFVSSLENAIFLATHSKVSIAADSWITLFDANSTWFSRKEVILLLDEFDAVGKIAEEERINFLTALRAIKQNRVTSKSIYCLLSVLVITNHLDSYMVDTCGNSPFNINDYVEAPYFTQEEINFLFNQYEEQEKIVIDERIKIDIYKNTAGAQGLTIMFASNFDHYRQEKKRNPSYSDWINYSNSREFVKRIVRYPNYKKMIKLVKEDKECKEFLIQKYYNPNSDFSSPENLIRSNILLESGIFSNPFVYRLIAGLLYTPISPRRYEVPIINEQLDMYRIICDAISYMNPLEIAGAPRKKKAYCLENAPELGPKEIVYVLAFKKALEIILNGYVIQLIPEVDAGGKSCDMVLSILGQKIAIEHGTNLISKSNSKNKMSVEMHVKSQAEYYHQVLQASQTWLLNWTTVANGNRKFQVPYYFPESETVNTLYVYHDRTFMKIEVVSKTRSDSIILPHIDLQDNGQSYESPSKVLHCSIVESPAKRARLGGMFFIFLFTLLSFPASNIYLFIYLDMNHEQSFTTTNELFQQFELPKQGILLFCSYFIIILM